MIPQNYKVLIGFLAGKVGDVPYTYHHFVDDDNDFVRHSFRSGYIRWSGFNGPGLYSRRFRSRKEQPE